MQTGSSALSQLVESVADGSGDLDWEVLERDVSNEAEKRLIRQLRILAKISAVHRSHADDDPAAASGEYDEAPSDVADVATEGVAADQADSKVIGRIEPRAGAPAATAVSVHAAESAPFVNDGARPASADPLPGPWGPLQLLEKVGEGTFGEVYRAFDTQLHREVAVKLLRVGKSPARLAERVLREGRVLARLHHPNVVVIHGAEARDGRVGMWMEYIRGATLEQLLKSQGTFSAREAALIGQDLCRAIAAVHAAGLVHRDIKAQNVMREEGGRVVLMDFGAGQLRHGMARDVARVTGTPLYLAPEVLNGGEASVRSDIYSLGVLLYHLVTGDFPVRAGSIDELRMAHAEGRIVRLQDARPDLPDAFVHVVERALQADPARRVASAGELQSLLAQSSVILPTPVTGTGFARAIGLPVRRVLGARARWGALVLVAVAVLAAAGLLAWRFGSGPDPTVVVMPFEAANEVPQHLVEDVTRRTVDLLGASKRLRVQTVRSANAAFPGLATADSAEYVLHGRLSSSTTGLQAAVRLTKTGSSTPMWSRTISGNGQRLSLGVADAVLAELAPIGSRTSGRLSSETAAELDARARYALEHGPDRADTAAALFREAVAADPGYARAHSGLARAYMLMGCRAKGPDALQTALLATTLDPGSAEGFTTLGDARYLCEWDPVAAESAYRMAVSLNPSDEFARTRFSMFLAASESAQAGLDQMLRGRDLDVMSATAAGATAQLLYYARRFEEAEREIRRALTLDGRFATAYLAYGRILSARGRFVEATRAFAQADALDPSGQHDYFLAEIAAADAGAGRTAEALAFVTDRERDRGRIPAEMVAFVYGRLGQLDRAFAWLDRAVDEHSERLLWLRVDPRADALRNDPRFEQILQRLSRLSP